MVQGKKASIQSNGTSKHSDQPSNMSSFQRKDGGTSRGNDGKIDARGQNGNASSFRTDTAISGNRMQGERTLQRWVADTPAEIDGSLESSSRTKSSGGGGWDQFAENHRRFGITTDYDENIYTTAIDKSHPQYKQRLADADKKAREIERSAANNSHVAEERITDNLLGDGKDEEDKYSGVRRQDFPPLSTSINKYTPPARRAPTGQSTVSGAPVDPAIISSQLARPDKPSAEKIKAVPAPAPKAERVEVATPPTMNESSVTVSPETKESKPVAVPAAAAVVTPASSAGRTASPQVKPEGTPNATATVERDVASAFKSFASQQRRNVESVRMSKIRNDKEVKLNDLKKFADSFKLHTPVPSDLVSIIAKDPAKQKEIQEKAKRNAEEAKVNPSEATKPVAPASEVRPAPRLAAAAHGTSPSTIPSRQNPPRNSQGFVQPGQFTSQSFRAERPSPSQQSMPVQQGRPLGQLGSRLRNEQNKPILVNPLPVHEARQPPTGPSNNTDPNFSRRSSGVTSAQGGRLNPNSSEFRPSPHAASFNPNGNPSTGSSPRSALNVAAPAPVTRSLLRRKPVSDSERPSLSGKFNALEHLKTIKPVPEKNWKATGGLKPAYDTPPTWRQVSPEDKPESTVHMTYTKLFEMAPFPAQSVSSPNPSHAVPQVPHQHQLPFHLQQNMGPRQSPRQPPMNMHPNQHGHGPNPPFNGADDHRMVPSHSAQSFQSPRMQNMQIGYPSPMGQPAQLAFNNQPMLPYPGGPPMQQYRSLSQSQQFLPSQGHIPQIMMQNPNHAFMASQGMAPGPQMMFPQAGPGFMPPVNGHPPAIPGSSGYPSPRSAPMMMSQGSQQGHQQQQPMFAMNPGMSPGHQYGAPVFSQQPPGQMPMRGYGGPAQFGTSPQQMHQFGGPHRNNHPNGNFNNNKNFQQHGQQHGHQNGPPNNQIPTGPQARNTEGGEEAK